MFFYNENMKIKSIIIMAVICIIVIGYISSKKLIIFQSNNKNFSVNSDIVFIAEKKEISVILSWNSDWESYHNRNILAKIPNIGDLELSLKGDTSQTFSIQNFNSNRKTDGNYIQNTLQKNIKKQHTLAKISTKQLAQWTWYWNFQYSLKRTRYGGTILFSGKLLTEKIENIIEIPPVNYKSIISYYCIPSLKKPLSEKRCTIRWKIIFSPPYKNDFQVDIRWKSIIL